MPLVARNLDTGAVVADRIAVADTHATRAVGLLSRDGLEPGEGLWIRDLASYYIPTDAYKRALRGEVRMVIGRKGSGKSALFFK